MTPWMTKMAMAMQLAVGSWPLAVGSWSLALHSWLQSVGVASLIIEPTSFVKVPAGLGRGGERWQKHGIGSAPGAQGTYGWRRDARLGDVEDADEVDYHTGYPGRLAGQGDVSTAGTQVLLGLCCARWTALCT